jgi:general secretion pathway protein L
VLGFEMDRYTPFMAGEVYYDSRVLSRDPARRLVQVSLTLVPRAGIAKFLDALRARGIHPAALEVQVRRLPLDEPGHKRRARGWPLRALAATAAVVTLAAAIVPLIQKAQLVERLERDIGALRNDASRAAQARQELERLVAEENALVDRRTQRPTAIRTVHELTRMLSDSTWLSHLDLNGTRVRIRGESSNSSEVLKTMENSAFFTEASFDGSVTRDAGSVRERFAISATVRPAGEPAGKPQAAKR